MDHTRERFCDDEYAMNDREEQLQLSEATLRSLQLVDASAETSTTSRAKAPLLSLRSQSGLAAELGRGSTSGPKPENAEGPTKKTPSGAISSRCSSSFLNENDLKVSATFPKPKPERYSDDASAAFKRSAPEDLVPQCSACERPLKSYRFVCLFDHGKGDREQVFCKDCIHTCPPEHVQLLVRNCRPLSSHQRELFNFLSSNKGTSNKTTLLIFGVCLQILVKLVDSYVL